VQAIKANGDLVLGKEMILPKKKFLAQNPRRQMFTKTDLAKFVLSFDEAPHEVSLGAQKAFSGTPRTKGLVGRISKIWDKHDGLEFNEVWFKRAIAKAIFFKELDRLVFRMPWYAGYKANIVTYSLAKFACMVREAGQHIDFLAIWEKQQLPDAIEKQLSDIAETVNSMLSNPPEGTTSNISEWAKKELCWDRVREAPIALSADVETLLIDHAQSKERENEGSRTQVIQDSIHAQTYVVEKGAAHWDNLFGTLSGSPLGNFPLFYSEAAGSAVIENQTVREHAESFEIQYDTSYTLVDEEGGALVPLGIPSDTALDIDRILEARLRVKLSRVDVDGQAGFSNDGNPTLNISGGISFSKTITESGSEVIRDDSLDNGNTSIGFSASAVVFDSYERE